MTDCFQKNRITYNTRTNERNRSHNKVWLFCLEREGESMTTKKERLYQIIVTILFFTFMIVQIIRGLMA